MIIPDRVRELFASVPVMAFPTVGEEGKPNTVAIASTKIAGDDSLWIIDTYFDKTENNLRENEEVAVTFWQGIEGYQMKGRAKYQTEGETFEEAKAWILEKKPDKNVKGVVEVKVDEIYSIKPEPGEAEKRVA